MSEDSESTGPNPIDAAVGHRIRVRRKWLGVSQSALAEHLGVSFQQVQKYERGANRTSASMLVRIAEKLKTTVGELVGEDEKEHVPSENLRLLALPGALELLRAYDVLSSNLRQAVLVLVRTLLVETRGEKT